MADAGVTLRQQMPDYHIFSPSPFNNRLKGEGELGLLDNLSLFLLIDSNPVMDELIRKLQEVNQQMGTLTQLVENLREERQTLQRRVRELEEALTEKDTHIRSQNLRYQAARIGQLTIDDGDRQALQSQIDFFVQEIDLCLKRFGD